MPYGASCTKKNPTRHINLRLVGHRSFAMLKVLYGLGTLLFMIS